MSRLPDSSLPDFSPSGDSGSSEPSSHALTATSALRARRGPERQRPLYLSRVPAGFPSPADDYIEASLDLSAEVIRHEEATFYLRMAGRSMTDIGIHDGDLIVVDRAVEPEDGAVVVAALDGELTVKRFETRSGNPYLMPESEDHDPIMVEKGQELVVWGVVTHVIHKVS